MKRFIAILLLATTIFSLSACTDKAQDNTQEAVSKAQYHVEYIKLPSDFSTTDVQIEYDNGLYIAGVSASKKLIHGLLKDDSFYPFDVPDESGTILAACKMDENIAALYSDEAKESLQILQYNSSGELISEIQLPEEPFADWSKFFSICYADEMFYLLSSNQFAKVDLTGAVVDAIDLAADEQTQGLFISQCSVGSDIAVCIYGYGSKENSLGIAMGTNIYLLDKAEFKLDSLYMGTNLSPLGIGAKDENTLLFFDQNSLYQIALSTGQAEEIVNWGDINLLLLPYNSIISIGADGYMLTGTGLDMLCKISYGVKEENRTELLLVCDYESRTLKTLVQRFNLTNEDYYITTRFSSNSASIDSVETISGKTPDLYFYAYNIPFNASLQQNKFADLYTFLDSDPEYGRDAIVESLRSALENRGSLYLMPFDYMIWTFSTTAQIENSDQMTIGQFIDAMEEKYPGQQIFQSNYSRSDMWYWMSNLCVGSFIDTQSATSYFDTDAYAEILESLMLLPQTAQGGDADGLFNMNQVGTILRIYAFDETYNNSYSFVGCPTGGLNSGSTFDLQQCFAMSATSEHKDGAWQFLRTALAPNVVNIDAVAGEICLPASTLQLQSMIDQALGDGYHTYDMYVKISEYGAQELESLIANTHSVMNAYPDVISIMQEEANKFFAGDKTAEEAAASTQSRVSVFMSEQYG
jgi:hypothetical protein